MSELTKGKKSFVKRHLGNESASILIGKSGVSEQLLKEINRQLEKNKMVKVKVLKTALIDNEIKQLTQKIAEQTNASLVETRGHTFILYKSRKK